MAARLFNRRRDGRIEVRLSPDGRAFVGATAREVVAAESDPNHAWGAALQAPIDPGRDADDPVAILSRQSDLASNAELVLATLDEGALTDGEAWAWFCTLQVALRSIAVANGLLDDDAWNAQSGPLVEHVQTIQALLFELARVL
ncbi:MAG TPA: hypothetical protein VFN59_01640 [Acidimicrobiales bacterium]|nr:hypothetical protein [Acidimicrobiales bacterium]